MTRQQPATDRATRVLEWLKSHRRALTGVLAVLVLGAGGVWFALSAKERREAFATRSLSSARAAAEAGNLALAASDLSRLIESYGGTQAADEATILLAQIRLSQGDTEEAVAILQQAISDGLDEQFAAPAQGLLGGALEEGGEMAAAARAYETAAEAAWYDFVAAAYLLDAGRAYVAAGDTGAAAAAYDRLLERYPDSPATTEARVRLAEIRPPGPATGPEG